MAPTVGATAMLASLLISFRVAMVKNAQLQATIILKIKFINCQHFSYDYDYR